MVRLAAGPRNTRPRPSPSVLQKRDITTRLPSTLISVLPMELDMRVTGRS